MMLKHLPSNNNNIRDTKKGYCLRASSLKVNHLLYLDDINFMVNLDHSYIHLFLQFLHLVRIYVTGPTKIGHICTQNLSNFLNFSSLYL